MRWISSLFLFLISPSVFAVQVHENVVHTKEEPNLHFSGYFDGSYNYLLHSNRFTDGYLDRLNDIKTNGTAIQQIQGTLAYLPKEGVGAITTALMGSDANQYAPQGLNPNVFGIPSVGFTLAKAFLQYSIKSYLFMAGEVLALAGIESYDYTQVNNFSSGILSMYAQPGSHIGLRGIANINKNLGLIAGVGNGWSTIKQAGHQDTIEMGAHYDVPKQFILPLIFILDPPMPKNAAQQALFHNVT